jgi:hypothetical protein
VQLAAVHCCMHLRHHGSTWQLLPVPWRCSGARPPAARNEPVQGCTATLQAPEGAPGCLYPPNGPSVLGMPYAAVSSPSTAVVGSTKGAVPDAQHALRSLSEPLSPETLAAAGAELQSGISQVWQGFGRWRCTEVRVCMHCAMHAASRGSCCCSLLQRSAHGPSHEARAYGCLSAQA